MEALSDSGCEIQFHIYTTYDMAVTEKLRQERTVDYLIVLETGALEQIAGMYAQESEDRPVIFGIDGLDSALSAIQDNSIQGTVYNDKEGQAGQISRLAMDLFLDREPEDYDFENERYIFLPYQKVTATNVEEFLH